MKRTLTAFILVLAFLLQGCVGNMKYYDTCRDAFLGFYGQPIDVTEVGTFEYSGKLVFYITVSEDCIFTCRMEEKADRVRVQYFEIDDVPTNSSPDHIDPWGGKTARLDTYLNSISYQWVATDCLPEERDGNYQYRDYSFVNSSGDTVRITLVYNEVYYVTEAVS